MLTLANGINGASLHVRGHFGQHKCVFYMYSLACSANIRHHETYRAKRVRGLDPGYSGYQGVILTARESKLLGQSFSDERTGMQLPGLRILWLV